MNPPPSAAGDLAPVARAENRAAEAQLGLAELDVRMLASLRLRRLARQWARLHHDVAARRAMADYQLARHRARAGL